MSVRVENKVVVQGSIEQVQLFKEKVGSADQCFDFNTVTPIPEDYRFNPERGELSHREWRDRYWGARSNAIDSRISEDTTPIALSYAFETAYNLPFLILIKLSAMFPELSILCESHFSKNNDPVLKCFINGAEVYVDSSDNEYESDDGSDCDEN